MLTPILATTVPLFFLLVGIYGGRIACRALAKRYYWDQDDTTLMFWLWMFFWPFVLVPCLIAIAISNPGEGSGLANWIMNGQQPRRRW